MPPSIGRPAQWTAVAEVRRAWPLIFQVRRKNEENKSWALVCFDNTCTEADMAAMLAQQITVQVCVPRGLRPFTHPRVAADEGTCARHLRRAWRFFFCVGFGWKGSTAHDVEV